MSSPAAVEALCEEILDSQRSYPIVGLTSRRHEQRPALPVDEVREILGEDAAIYVIPTGRATATLKACLPPRLDAYGGAARIWWPGVSPNSAPWDHPLLYDPSGTYGHQALEALAAWFLAGPGDAPVHPGKPRVSDERLALELAALAHPIGLRMMRAVWARPEFVCTAVDVSHALGLPVTLVSHHLRILDRAGLLTTVETLPHGGFNERGYAPTERGRRLFALLATLNEPTTGCTEESGGLSPAGYDVTRPS